MINSECIFNFVGDVSIWQKENQWWKFISAFILPELIRDSYL